MPEQALAAMHIERVDLVIRYALAIAREGDFGERELGEIHLLKYVYLADLAHAAANAAETFTGAPWRFFKFGPWAHEVHARIQPVVGSLDVEERVFSSPKFEGEGVRWQLRAEDDQVTAQLERQLPWQVARAVKEAVRRYGDDTTELLHHVYATEPMLNAVPNEMLVFKVSESRPPYQKSADVPLTERQKKKRRQALDATRQALRARLDAAKPKAVPAEPAPRYDEVFSEGVKALDSDVGEELRNEDGEIIFSPEIWKSRGRHDTGDR